MSYWNGYSWKQVCYPEKIVYASGQSVPPCPDLSMDEYDTTSEDASSRKELLGAILQEEHMERAEATESELQVYVEGLK